MLSPKAKVGENDWGGGTMRKPKKKVDYLINEDQPQKIRMALEINLNLDIYVYLKRVKNSLIPF